MKTKSYYCVGWTDSLGAVCRPNNPDESGYVDAEDEASAEAKFRAENAIPDDCEVKVVID